VEVLGRIAYASGGRIGYQPFSEELCMLGYAAASDVFGASLYEPCGQIDQVGNIFGATATNRDTGGYHDKIRELRLKSAGAPQDVGNGFCSATTTQGVCGTAWRTACGSTGARRKSASPRSGGSCSRPASDTGSRT